MHILKVQHIGQRRYQEKVGNGRTLRESIQHSCTEALVKSSQSLLRVDLEDEGEHGLVPASRQCLYPRLGTV